MMSVVCSRWDLRWTVCVRLYVSSLSARQSATEHRHHHRASLEATPHTSTPLTEDDCRQKSNAERVKNYYRVVQKSGETHTHNETVNIIESNLRQQFNCNFFYFQLIGRWHFKQQSHFRLMSQWSAHLRGSAAAPVHLRDLVSIFFPLKLSVTVKLKLVQSPNDSCDG